MKYRFDSTSDFSSSLLNLRRGKKEKKEMPHFEPALRLPRDGLGDGSDAYGSDTAPLCGGVQSPSFKPKTTDVVSVDQAVLNGT